MDDTVRSKICMNNMISKPVSQCTISYPVKVYLKIKVKSSFSSHTKGELICHHKSPIEGWGSAPQEGRK